MWKILYLYLIIFIISVIDCDCTQLRPVNYVPPVPGLPPNTDPTVRPPPTATASTTRRTTTPPPPPTFSNSYLPAVMQAIAYYTDLLQYEPIERTTIEPPFTLSPHNDETPRLPVKPTSPRPTTLPLPPQTTQSHRPGQYAPVLSGTMDNGDHPMNDRGTNVERPQIGVLPLLSISHMDFFNWFLQTKHKTNVDLSEYNLQNLDPLPSKLLHEILTERYEPPSILDVDNVNDFLYRYDDSYRNANDHNEDEGDGDWNTITALRRQPDVGHKRVPPTKPYVQMLMLYDLLKREAKRLQLHKFSGYSEEMIQELNETAKGSAERQLYTLMKRMIEQKAIDKMDVLARSKSIMDDLINPYTVTSMALRYIPPLVFEL